MVVLAFKGSNEWLKWKAAQPHWQVPVVTMMAPTLTPSQQQQLGMHAQHQQQYLPLQQQTTGGGGYYGQAPAPAAAAVDDRTIITSVSQIKVLKRTRSDGSVDGRGPAEHPLDGRRTSTRSA